MAHDCARDGSPSFGLSGCYWHLKAAALRGEDLTEAELAFVGFAAPLRSDDWTPLGNLGRAYGSLDDEDRETFRAIVDLPRASQMDFLS